MMRLFKFAPLLLAAGCAAVGPDWTPPKADVPTRFVGGSDSPAGQLARRAWWTEFHDPMLNDLVSRGLGQSLDVKAAEERIQQANAQLRQTGVNAALDGTATVGREGAGATGSGRSWESTGDLSASFVIDLFGGIRRDREAAAANLQAAQADVGTTRLAWLADLVAAYADARYYQQALALTRQTIATRQRTFDVTNNQFNAGSATDYDVAEAQAALETAQADLPNYLALFRSNVFAVAALLNEPAGPLMQKMEKGAAPLRVPGSASTGIPADLLRNRPDVRYYEAVLHQQVAQVGVAEADLFPSVSLTGDVSAVDSTKSWSFGPSISLALLNRGSLRAARDAQVSAAKQAEIDWRSSVTDAVRDVQVAQSNLQQYRHRTSVLERSANSYARALGLAQQSYENGALTLLDLLDTDRNEATAKISAASAQNDAAQEWATLMIATGAGALVGAEPAEGAPSASQAAAPVATN